MTKKNRNRNEEAPATDPIQATATSPDVDPPTTEVKEVDTRSHYARYKASHLKYQNSEKGKAARNRYQKSEKAKARRKEYQKRRNEELKAARKLLKESGVLAGVREGSGN